MASIKKVFLQEMTVLPNGTRVRLPPNEFEGFPEEFGEIIDFQSGPKMYTVLIDKEYRDGPEDDGYREVDALPENGDFEKDTGSGGFEDL